MLTMLTTTELEKQENKMLGKALANIQQVYDGIWYTLYLTSKLVMNLLSGVTLSNVYIDVGDEMCWWQL